MPLADRAHSLILQILSKHYGRLAADDDVSLTVPRAPGWVAAARPSGCVALAAVVVTPPPHRAPAACSPSTPRAT